MKKIAQIKERWSHRRVVSAPAAAPEQPQPQPQSQPSVPLVALPELDIGAVSERLQNLQLAHGPIVDGLCRRCERLHLGSSKQHLEALKAGHIATVRESSLLDGCHLCFQFRKILEALCSSDSGSTGQEEFSLWCHHLAEEDPRVRGEVYFSIHANNSTVNIRLLPKQGALGGLVLDIGRTVQPDQPDYEFVLTSLDTCRYYHGEHCSQSLSRVHNLRVIDCQSRRIILAEPDQRYICLSYVWGRGAIEETEVMYTELPAVVPKTVEDAMVVAVNLDIPYLWVDRYCIDQANPEEKHNVIRNMDRIYEAAEITIIAASGDDPHQGLPGVRGTPRKSQPTLRVGGEVFVAAEEVAGPIHNSKWATRGWTYQEMLLSRRRLVFTNSQMYFQCTMMHGVESLCPNATTPSGPFRALYRVFPHGGIGHTEMDMKRRLIEYYRRQLSFKTDIIHAFAGIVNAFNSSKILQGKATHFYGIPIIYADENLDLATESFVLNLTWSIHFSSTTRPDPIQRTDAFPSWSWASAKADQADTTPGELLHESYHIDHIDIPPWAQNDTQVHVHHVQHGEMDMPTFIHQNHGYEHFLPRIKVTSWVLDCTNTPPTTTTTPSLHILGERVRLEDASAPHHTHFRILFLGIYQLSNRRTPHPTHYSYRKYMVQGLVLREVKPALYRRVGLWDSYVRDAIDSQPASVEDLLVAMLEAEKQRQVKRGLEPAGELLGCWQRGSLCIV
ncbi:HET-domain-containing protein [Decorospora gaudefroyi]|uniref:HET-domain-containing protein n=1 Tax=Decorospora gaudefroyi TaxID=184978 RepID=A0A6A5KRK3_9PLEO|nr:HET-domain-containing protein [Decorospora gaudefroyi]